MQQEKRSGRRQLGRRIEELAVGDRAVRSQRITDRDVYLYMGLTEDFNPIYVEREYAGRTAFATPIVPGILVAGHIVAALTGQLPGPGTITVAQRFNFIVPVRCGDTLTTELEVTEIKVKENRATLKTVTRNQDGIIVVIGESEVEPPPKLRPVLSDVFEGYE